MYHWVTQQHIMWGMFVITVAIYAWQALIVVFDLDE